MHIAPYDNQNSPLVDVDDATVPLNYFNVVKLTKDQVFDYQVPGYETCIVPATGTVDVEVEGYSASAIGGRGEDVWDGEPEGVYVPKRRQGADGMRFGHCRGIRCRGQV